MAKPKQRRLRLNPEDMLSSGSTLLNLFCSGQVEGAYGKGMYVYYVGDSMSGKTWLVLTALAEATKNESFENYRLIYDDAEDGALMSLEQYFGREVVDRLEPPGVGEDGEEKHSTTIEDFYDHITDALDEAESEDGQPFIYILDSMDALDSEAAISKFAENKNLRRRGKGKEAKGSYGDGKAKKNSETLRGVRSRVARTGSILIIISQTRDEINAMTFATKTRAGGRALTFYAHLEIWTSTVETMKKEYRGEKIKVGQRTRCRVKKNRMTGRTGDTDLRILSNYGVDDIGDMIDYLVKNKHWLLRKKSIVAPELDFTGSRAKLINHIEENDFVYDLQLITKEVFDDIQSATVPKRKKRYG